MLGSGQEAPTGERTEHTPGDLAMFLNQHPPARDAPAAEWVLWHELLVEVWDQIATDYPFMTDNARYLVTYHTRLARRCVEALRRTG